jgi:nitric oxide reductase NorQ protein
MENILIIPEKKPYVISSTNRERIQLAKKRSDAGKQTNILIKGATGTGKSEMVAQVAANWNRPFCIIPVGGLDSANSIFGRVDLEDGATVFRPGLFLQAIQTPNAVIHLEEINRPENDKALNAIFGVLDDTSRSIWIDELQELIHVAPGVTFFASLNEGFEFIGTMPLDVALKNRFAIKMELGILPSYAEAQIVAARVDGFTLEKATELVESVNALRENAVSPIEVSTRDILSIAEFQTLGMSFQSAFLTTVDSSPEILEQVLLLKHMAGEETSGLNNEYTLL